jgi:hypothetical protein
MARTRKPRPASFVPLDPDAPTTVPIPKYRDPVVYHDPDSGRMEDAVILRVHRPGDPLSPVDLVFVDGEHDIIARNVEPHAGRFGAYTRAGRGPA